MSAETRHPTDEEITLFVLRAFDQITFEGIEEHLDRCEACAAKLAREAQLELEVRAVAAATRWCPRCSVASDVTCHRCGIALNPGGYEVEAVLSEYGQGRTYRGRAPDGSPVRISELEFAHVQDHGVVEAFVRDATLLAQLDHPNVPRLIDSFREGDDEHLRLYAVEAWVEAEPLDEVLDRHRFDEAEARHIAEQVLDVLVYLQGLSPAIFHRDIRPQNLLYAADGTVYVRQFANARDMSVTGAFTLAGHTGYIPAEQHLGVVDATSDLYGLGATLAHLLTRRAPLPGQPGLERANVSAPFAAWLSRLMALRPQDRFPSALAARDALSKPPSRRRAPWRSAVLVLAVFLGSAAVASVAVRVMQPRPPAPPAPPATGMLVLESQPSGARIYVDGRLLAGGTTPADVRSLVYGRRYELRMELDGHVPHVVTKTMDAKLDGDIVFHRFVPEAPAPDEAPKADEPARRGASKKPPATGDAPPKSRVTAGAEPDAQTASTATPNVAPTRKTRLADLHVDRPRPDRPYGDVPPPSPGCAYDLDAPAGYVTLNTKPYADVYWGEQHLGQTPLARVRLPAGCIRIRAVAVNGAQQRAVNIKVTSNEVAIYRFDLE